MSEEKFLLKHVSGVKAPTSFFHVAIADFSLMILADLGAEEALEAVMVEEAASELFVLRIINACIRGFCGLCPRLCVCYRMCWDRYVGLRSEIQWFSSQFYRLRV
jgi:hypothetical protein